MPLSTYTIPTATIPLGRENNMVVRGISFPDLTFLMQEHLPVLTAILSKYKDARDDIMSRRSIADLALMIARDFPTFATEMISVCITGEDETADRKELATKVAMLGAPVQIMAMVEIARLTTEESGGLKNLMAGLRTKLETAMADAARQATEARNDL